MSTLEVVAAGPQTTIQDLGRHGHGWAGVPVAGALDRAALVAANRAVGNADSAAGLECVLRGPTLVVDADFWIAVVGAGWAVGPRRVAAGVAYPVDLPAGLRCWVAVSGGIDTVPVLGSRSTDTMGGLGGRALRNGDRLRLGPPGMPGAEPVAAPELPAVPVLRVLAGPHADRLAATLDGVHLTVDPASNRSGVRFKPEPTMSVRAGDVATIPVLPGALQLPPGGGPILLLANGQTTGGYPVVGVVCEADLRLAAQLRPGRRVRLWTIGMDEARELSAQAAF